MKNSQQGRHLAPSSNTKGSRQQPSRAARPSHTSARPAHSSGRVNGRARERDIPEEFFDDRSLRRGEEARVRRAEVHVHDEPAEQTFRTEREGPAARGRRADSPVRSDPGRSRERETHDSSHVQAVIAETPRTAADFSLKKRALFIAGYICLLLAFMTGAVEVLSFKEARVSESENRMLQGFPEFSVSRVVSGDFMSEMESYLSDAFFFRDEVADFTDRQLGLFAMPNDGPDTWDVDAEHLDAPVEVDEPDIPAEDISAAEVPIADEPEEISVPESMEVDPSIVQKSEFYLLNENGDRTVLYTFSPEQMASFATMLNMYRDALPEDGTLHYCVPPVSYHANNILQKHNYTGWGSDLDDVLQPVVNDGIYVYDVTDILTPYLTTSRLYPIEDHHWHPLSASLVCEEMLRNQGVPPMDYYEYRYYVSSVPGYVTFYGDELKKLSLTADTVEIMQPVTPVESYMLKHLTERSSGVFIDETHMGLLAYLGGLRGPWRLFITGFHTGRNAIMVTDSYGMTFAPFLAPYYDQILFVDLRPSLFSLDVSGGTIKDYIEYYDIDDMYMLSSAFNEDIVDGVQSRLFQYLG